MTHKGYLSLFALLLIYIWAMEARSGELTTTEFLEQNASKIEKARSNLVSRSDRGIEPFYRQMANQYVRSFTPLHIASQDGDLVAVRQLIEEGEDINALSEEGATPLSMATVFNRLDIMESLLQSGANPNTGVKPPLWEAAALKSLPAIRLLLQYGADPTSGAPKETTPLFVVLFNPWLVPNERIAESLQLLLEAGANPNTDERKALIWVMAQKVRGAEDLLLAHGVQPPESEAYSDPEPPDLHRAAQQGDLDTVKALVHGGADINQSDGMIGLMPAQYAAESGHMEVLAWLAEHGADLISRTPRPVDDIFLAAAMGDNVEIMHLCLAHGVPVDYSTKFGKTVLAVVVTNSLVNSRNWDTVKFLLENGADINWRDEYGMTPLHMMAAAQLWEFDKVGMQRLIQAGADCDALDNSGLSPLHYAAARGNMRAMAVISEGMRSTSQKGR